MSNRYLYFFFKVIISSLAVMVSAWILPGVDIDGYFTAVAAALLLAFLNAFLRPVLVLLTLPATILTLGLFLLVINAAIILLIDKFLEGFTVSGFWWALLFSLLLSIVTSVFEGIDRRPRDRDRY